MFCLTVSYPTEGASHFDFDYYEQRHLALVQEKFGPFGLQQVLLRKFTSSKPGGAPAYFASADLVFSSIDAMKQATSAAGAEIGNDIPNYTDSVAEYRFSDWEDRS